VKQSEDILYVKTGQFGSNDDRSQSQTTKR